MREIDEIRGIEKAISVGDEPGHTTRGEMPISNCVVEVTHFRADPVLSLRFYYKPFYGYKTATELAQRGHPVIDGDTTTGVQLDLGYELARSLVEQIQAKWPELVKALADAESDSSDAS